MLLFINARRFLAFLALVSLSNALSLTFSKKKQVRKNLPKVLEMRGGEFVDAAKISLLATALLANASPAAAQAATSSVELVNCVGGASGFFGGVRVPCSLLAGASLGQLGTVVGKEKELPDTAYKTLMGYTFTVCMMVLTVSTAMGTRLHGSVADPMAANTLAFLVREYELPFLACRMGFVSGLLSFMGATAVRVRHLPALPTATTKGLCAFICAMMAACLALFNNTLVNYENNALFVVKRLVELTLLNPAGYLKPVTLAGLVCGGVGVYWLIIGLLEAAATGKKE